MGIADEIHNSISVYNISERDAEFPFRGHLGASVLGHTCSRYLWYHFRWFRLPSHSSRMQRLFERGRREEKIIIQAIRDAGYVLSTNIPELCRNTGLPVSLNSLDVMKGWGLDIYKPLRLSPKEEDDQLKANFPPHLGGSMDAILHVPAHLVAVYGYFMPVEIKTHNKVSFRGVIKDGASTQYNKPQHYVQGCSYATRTGCTHFLYVAKNKDDDEMYLRDEQAQQHVTALNIIRAEQIIYKQYSIDAPKTQEKWRCNMCEYKPICKEKNTELIHRNCRTCKNAVPRSDGSWVCDAFNTFIEHKTEIDVAAQCNNYERIT